MNLHFSEQRLLQFYKPLPKTQKNDHEVANLAHLTKISKFFFVLLNLQLSYEHQRVKFKQIRENFNF